MEDSWRHSKHLCNGFWSGAAVQDTLVEQLELCVDYLWKSERHELIADINKPVIAVFEKRRDFKVAVNLHTVGVSLFELVFTIRVCLCVSTEAVRAVL